MEQSEHTNGVAVDIPEEFTKEIQARVNEKKMRVKEVLTRHAVSPLTIGLASYDLLILDLSKLILQFEVEQFAKNLTDTKRLLGL